VTQSGRSLKELGNSGIDMNIATKEKTKKMAFAALVVVGTI